MRGGAHGPVGQRCGAASTARRRRRGACGSRLGRGDARRPRATAERGAAEVPPRRGQGAAEVRPRRGRGAAERDVAVMRPRCARGAAEVCLAAPTCALVASLAAHSSPTRRKLRVQKTKARNGRPRKAQLDLAARRPPSSGPSLGQSRGLTSELDLPGRSSAALFRACSRRLAPSSASRSSRRSPPCSPLSLASAA